MKIPCPACGKQLAVGDDFAGRRVKCPGCQQVFQVPAAAAAPGNPGAKPAQTEVTERPATPPKPPQPAALKKGPPPVKPRKVCPECGAALVADESECTECDWTRDEPKSKAVSREAPAEGDQGLCYVRIRKDEVDLTQDIEKRMEKLFETEDIDMRMADEDDDPPEELGPNDLVISGKVEECNYGSQFVRAFLGIIALLGPGSCNLRVDATVESGEGEDLRVKARSRMWTGFFGGSGTGLMKRNVKIVGRQIAYKAARHVTGRWFLNAQAYSCGYWSLALGIGALLPCAGIVFAPIGLIVGFLGLVTVFRRGLPRGKIAPIIGILLSFLGLVVQVGFMMYVMNSKK